VNTTFDHKPATKADIADLRLAVAELKVSTLKCGLIGAMVLQTVMIVGALAVLAKFVGQ
jgi:hypothetical protein